MAPTPEELLLIAQAVDNHKICRTPRWTDLCMAHAAIELTRRVVDENRQAPKSCLRQGYSAAHILPLVAGLTSRLE
jgi:hypothetical protein